MSIRREVSNMLGYTIPEGEWEDAFTTLDRDGRITMKHVIKILALLLEREENRENDR